MTGQLDRDLLARCAKQGHALAVRLAHDSERAACQFTYSEGEYAVGPIFEGRGSVEAALAAIVATGRSARDVVMWEDGGYQQMNVILGYPPEGTEPDHELDAMFGCTIDPRLYL